MRRSLSLQFWYGQSQFDRMFPNLPDRQGYERKLGHRCLRNLVHNESQNRKEEDPQRTRSIRQVNLQAAANEQGTSHDKLKHDLARQRVGISSETMLRIAQFEPMAFRALVELTSSDIAPPPRLNPESLKLTGQQVRQATEAAIADLEYDVGRMVKALSSPLVDVGSERDSLCDEKQWMNAWQNFVVENEK